MKTIHNPIRFKTLFITPSPQRAHRECRWAYNQDHDEHDERKSIRPGTGDIAGNERLEQPQQQPADHGAGDIADPADDRRDECVEAVIPAHVEVDPAIVEADEQSPDGAQRRPDDENGHDDGVDIDPHQPGRILVDGAGPNRGADAGFVDKKIEGDHEHAGENENQQLDITDDHAADRPGDRRKQVRREKAHPRPPEQHDAVFNHQAGPQGRNHGTEPRRVPQGPVGNAFEQHADHGNDHGAQDENNNDREERGRSPQNLGIQGQAHERRQRDQVAMSEVDELHDPVHHGIPEGHQREDAADGQPVYQLLKKDVHKCKAFSEMGKSRS